MVIDGSNYAMLHGDTTENISKNRKELEAEGTASIVLSLMGDPYGNQKIYIVDTETRKYIEAL